MRLGTGDHQWHLKRTTLSPSQPEELALRRGFIYAHNADITITTNRETVELAAGEARSVETNRPNTAELSTVQPGTNYAIHLAASSQVPPPESGTTLRDRVSLENGDYVLALFAATAGSGGAFALPADNLATLVIILDGSIVLEQPGKPALALAVGHAASTVGVGTFRVDVTGDAQLLMATLTLANS